MTDQEKKESKLKFIFLKEAMKDHYTSTRASLIGLPWTRVNDSYFDANGNKVNISLHMDEIVFFANQSDILGKSAQASLLENEKNEASLIRCLDILLKNRHLLNEEDKRSVDSINEELTTRNFITII
jgi:hypothetical protein